MSQQVLASPRTDLELTNEDLIGLERLSVESTVDVDEFYLISEIAEKRRMAIILLLAEISSHRQDYVFSLDCADDGTL